MSNQTRRVSTKSTTKRRAETRRRVREFGRHFFAYFMIAILVLGTISTVILAPAGTVAPTITPVPTVGAGQFDALITQGDQAVAAGKPNEAVGFYGAYLGQNPGSPEVNLKIAKAYIASTPPKYNEAADNLNRVLTINPSGPFATEAITLLGEIRDKVTPVSSPSQSVITGTAGISPVITGTSSVVAPSTTITATQPITR